MRKKNSKGVTFFSVEDFKKKFFPNLIRKSQLENYRNIGLRLARETLKKVKDIKK